MALLVNMLRAKGAKAVSWDDFFPEHRAPRPRRTWQESKALADQWVRDTQRRAAAPARKKPKKRGR